MKAKLLLMTSCLLFLGATVMAWQLWAQPLRQEEKVTLLNYELKTSWEQQAYGRSATGEGGGNPSYFSRLIESMEWSYNYKFLPEKPVRQVQTEVEIKAVMESPGIWQKEMLLMKRSQQSAEFTLSFPLDLAAIRQAGSVIAQELGTAPPSADITLKAVVHTVAETDTGLIIEDDFIQTVGIRTKGATLEWDRELGLSQRGYRQGMKWEHRGGFGYTLTLKPSLLYAQELALGDVLSGSAANEKTEPNPVYFTRLIDSIEVSYDYSFLTSQPVQEVKGWAEIRALVENPGLWQKELTLVERKEQQGLYSTSFLLDTAMLSALAAEIDKELGTTGSPRVSLKAVVHTEAVSGDQVLSEDLVQPLGLKIANTTLEIDRGISYSRSGWWQGIKYEHLGNFSYGIKLKPNSLVGAITITSPPPKQAATQPYPPQVITLPAAEREPPARLGFSQVYNAKDLERVDMILSYELVPSKPLDAVEHNVQVKAVLGNSGGWEESFPIVAQSYTTDKFNLGFSLDMPLLYYVVADWEKRIGTSSPAYDLAIITSVTTEGWAAGHSLEEGLQRTFTIRLEKDKVVMSEMNPETRSGTIAEELVVKRQVVETGRLGSVAGVGLTGALLLGAGLNYSKSRRKRLSCPQAEALQAKKKYKEIVVDVQELPKHAGQAVVAIGSLEELVKAAEALLKPVLHSVEGERHVYCVIDGQTYYQYVSQIEEPSTLTVEYPPSEKHNLPDTT